MILSLADLVANGAAQHPARPALCQGDHTLDYAALHAAVQAARQALLRLGLPRHARVAVHADKQIEVVVAMLAASAAGAVFVPINPGLKPAQVAHILMDSGAEVLVSTAARVSLAAPALGGCPALRHVVVIGGPAAPELPSGVCSVGWADWLGAAGPSPTGPASLIDADPAALLYTSGSTGQPKGVIVSHRNLVEGARSVAAYLPLGPADVVLAVLPLSFDYGLNQLSQCFLVGACAVLHTHLLARDVIQALQASGATALAGVPPLWIQLAGLDWPAEVVQRLRFITNSGGHMPASTLAQLRHALPHTAVFLMYGLTEAFRSTFLPPDELDRRPGSMGRAIPNAEVLVLREDGSECDADEPGELVHRGVHVALGYWNDPVRTAERFRPLPPRTGLPLPELAVWSGDLVRRDAEGWLYFIGRRDDTIKTSGYRVSPTEVEDVVSRVEGVAEAAAFGVPHPAWGQAIVVVLQCRAGASVDVAAVQQACRRELASHLQPAWVEIGQEALPRNPNGKFDRPLLVARHRLRFSEDPGP